MKTKNRSVKLLAILLLFGGIAFNASAQSSLSILQSKTWVMQFPSPMTYTFSVQNNSAGMEVCTMYFEGKATTTNYKYYLSNTIESTFNSAKIGTVSDGKYIIVEEETKQVGGPIQKIVAVYEIIKLDANNLELKNLRNSSILTYKPKV